VLNDLRALESAGRGRPHAAGNVSGSGNGLLKSVPNEVRFTFVLELLDEW
jgi:hypothetical protein